MTQVALSEDEVFELLQLLPEDSPLARSLAQRKTVADKIDALNRRWTGPEPAAALAAEAARLLAETEQNAPHLTPQVYEFVARAQRAWRNGL